MNNPRQGRAMLAEHTASIYAGAFSPEGSILAMGVDDTVRLWSSTEKFQATFIDHVGGIHEVAFPLGCSGNLAMELPSPLSMRPAP